MCSLLDYDEVWSGERIPTFGRTYCLSFHAGNGGYIALIDAGTYHSLEDDSMKVVFSLNCSVVKVDHSFNNTC
jgi:succinate dehydrogenase/fumarate reductase cytochrome b subunit